MCMCVCVFEREGVKKLTSCHDRHIIFFLCSSVINKQHGHIFMFDKK